MTLQLRIANVLLHILHLGVVAFLICGWIFPQTRAYHLAFVLLTLGSWMALGYCPLTELHWRVRRLAGMPEPNGPYIPFLISQLTRGPVDVKRLDKVVVAFTIAIALLSIMVNAARYF